MNWKLIVAILCFYGFFKEFTPLDPFITPYLRSDLKNFTDVQLYSQVYPVWTYSYLVALVPTFLLTDLLRYNIVLIICALCYASTWILLIFGTTIDQMQLMQFFYGVASAEEIAYYAYGYAAIDQKHYKKATSYMRFVIECGRFSSYAVGQTLISTRAMSYLDLNYIAFAGSILILVLALFLPCISWKHSLDRVRDADMKVLAFFDGERATDAKSIDSQLDKLSIDQQSTDPKSMTPKAPDNKSTSKPSDRRKSIINRYPINVESYCGFVRFYFLNLWATFSSIYSTSFMWKWSLWCALATCGMLQVTNYIQTLWDLMQTSEDDVWNGIVEAINTFLAAIVVVCLQFLSIRWDVWGECTLAILSIIDCVMLIVISQTASLVLNYILYIIFRVLYETMFTIAMYNIAKNLATESFGLVFGFNMFVALVLQTILTVAVADERGFELDIRQQFVVYGVYHGLIAIVFLIMGTLTLVRYFRNKRSTLAEHGAFGVGSRSI